MQEGNLASGAPKFTPFPVATADSLYKKGQLYLHTWAPYDWKNAIAWTPDDICAGKYDAYLVAQARLIAKWGHPCWVRFCHEFNGSWSKWFWPPADFLRVWTYVVTLFRREGANNISWVWGPNQVDPVGSASSTAADKLEAYLPDPSLYDWASWDAYNWGDARGGSWQTFSQINDLTYATLDRLVPDKPLMIAEYGCHETPGDKTAWVTDALATAPTRYPRLRAMVYYPVQPASGTWPLNAAAGAAYAAGIKAGPYAVTGQYPMPPDGAPIKPLYGAEWGGADADDLRTQLDLANAKAVFLQSRVDWNAGEVDRLTGVLGQVQTQYNTATEALAASRTEVDRWRMAGSQVTTGLDNMRSILLP